jgi:dGTP triphosphohydrolase
VFLNDGFWKDFKAHTSSQLDSMIDSLNSVMQVPGRDNTVWAVLQRLEEKLTVIWSEGNKTSAQIIKTCENLTDILEGVKSKVDTISKCSKYEKHSNILYQLSDNYTKFHNTSILKFQKLEKITINLNESLNIVLSSTQSILIKFKDLESLINSSCSSQNNIVTVTDSKEDCFLQENYLKKLADNYTMYYNHSAQNFVKLAKSTFHFNNSLESVLNLTKHTLQRIEKMEILINSTCKDTNVNLMNMTIVNLSKQILIISNQSLSLESQFYNLTQNYKDLMRKFTSVNKTNVALTREIERFGLAANMTNARLQILSDSNKELKTLIDNLKTPNAYNSEDSNMHFYMLIAFGGALGFQLLQSLMFFIFMCIKKKST